MRIAIVPVLLLLVLPSISRGQAPVVEMVPQESWIQFHVKASTTIAGKFDKWDGKLTFASPDETTAFIGIGGGFYDFFRYKGDLGIVVDSEEIFAL